MPVSLGLDIGSNSVGSAWVDTDADEVVVGASVFPAGVAEADGKLGEPKNQARRNSRSLRRSLARRAERKHRLRRVLTDAGLLPSDSTVLAPLFDTNPWLLRRKGLHDPLTPFEFGRVLIHLNQRRGALGVETDSDDDDKGAVSKAIDCTRDEMLKRGAKTFGQMMADLYDERQQESGRADKTFRNSIRNRRASFEFHASRPLIRDEFGQLWHAQRSFGGELAALLTEKLRRRLDDPVEDPTWRHRGEIFGQRRTYWRTGSLDRCDLEPTDRRCPWADRYAQEFLLLETVNNIRVQRRDEPSERPLMGEERLKVIAVLRSQKTGKPATIRKALGINKKSVKDFYTLNVERDPDREINTDWFYREIVHGVFTEDGWLALSEAQQEAVNRSILKFDSDKPEHAKRIESGAQRWWGLPAERAAQLVIACRERPIKKPVNLSRRAIRNLLPYLHQGLTVTEARKCFAEDEDSPASPQQRVRYALTFSLALRGLLAERVGDEEAQRLIATHGSNKADRHYLRKHHDPLPPAPMLSNPVVRKAIHEVRRHILAYWHRFGRRPDRIVIELARETKQSERVRNARLDTNRKREKERKAVIEEHSLAGLTSNQQRAAVDRVLLCRQQRGICAYSDLGEGSGRAITEETAAAGTDVEIDHIVPRSRSQDNGLNNKVLCLRSRNRDKANRTVKEWLNPDDFAHLLQRFASWKKELPRKWENLNRDAPTLDDFVASQLTDTAYAARQVAGFLRSALYGDDTDNRQRIFFTNGRYTAQLRRDWQLQDDTGPKPRVDHRHHAIDAIVIALTTPDRLQNLAHFTAEQERARAASDRWPKRQPLPTPWGDVQTFRAQILKTVDSLIVSHRPVKRKLIGAFHEETLYGPVLTRRGVSDTQFTNRIFAEAIKPNHLRVPKGWDDLSRRLHDSSIPPGERRSLRVRMIELPDPPPGKSGIVRDRELRDQIRRCLRSNGLDPDDFAKNDIKRLTERNKLCVSSAVPIRRVVLLRTINDPVLIPRKKRDHATNKMIRDDDPRTVRAYIGGNNHHLEIREDRKTGKWSGEVIDGFTAAKRVRIEKLPAVDRNDDPEKGGRFIMSLAMGEMIHMRHPTTKVLGYFVVFKLDKPRTVQFTHHCDARPAKLQQDDDGRAIPNSKREEIPVPPSKLKHLGPEQDVPPYKVRVNPLGAVQRLGPD